MRVRSQLPRWMRQWLLRHKGWAGEPLALPELVWKPGVHEVSRRCTAPAALGAGFSWRMSTVCLFSAPGSDPAPGKSFITDRPYGCKLARNCSFECSFSSAARFFECSSSSGPSFPSSERNSSLPRLSPAMSAAAIQL